ncbi:AAA ATPase [Calothrix sp. NIES-2100]|uniref:AAA family ATPase n=1 Tax=Calothrix sp. NIES-2100 TaxID=1954172 RepID=UPI000B5F9B47|nr:AAA ATPase [Calothrix sp. NIES-2100]
MWGRVAIYESNHIGQNMVILPKSIYETYQTNEREPVFVEINSSQESQVKAYGQAWYDETNQFQNNGIQEVYNVGLEQSLINTCLLKLGDIVKIEPIQPSDIQEAISLELEFLGDSSAKIQTEKDLQYLKNRILGSEIILAQESRFIIPIKIADISQKLLCRVLKIEPEDVPVRCNEKTSILFRGLSVKTESSSVSFSNIGGLKKPISLLREMVQLPMEHPQVFLDMGIEPPKGVLLYGSPGNGKTLLARVIAQEVNAKFYVINGPEITSKFVGEGERKLRDIFEKARLNAPAIIFMDEIDSIAGKRDGFSAEFEIKLVAQLLSLMDGLDNRGNVVVIAATNRPHAIDPALRRPGRFDREIEVTLPTEEERFEILQVHNRKVNLDPDINLQDWAKKTTGYTGADLSSLTKEAAMRCFRRIFELASDGHYIKIGEPVVTDEDFLAAFKELQPTNLRDLPPQEETFSWNEIIGATSIKEQLASLIETPLKDPRQLKLMGLTTPPGILLVSGSRSGKKSLIFALAKKLNLQCIVVRALDLINQNPRNREKQTLAEIFRKVRLSSPSILLIDKIDSVFSEQMQYNMESFVLAEDLADEIRRNRLYDNVFVVATARTTQYLPPILLEHSVFSHVLQMPIPSLDECELIIKSKLGKHFSNDAEIKELAKSVQGLNTGEVIYICEESLRMSIRASLEFQNTMATGFKQIAQFTKESKCVESEN